VAWKVEIEDGFWDREGAGACLAKGDKGEGRERTEGDVFGYFVVVACSFSVSVYFIKKENSVAARAGGICGLPL
jgi:hypothetical protein